MPPIWRWRNLNSHAPFFTNLRFAKRYTGDSGANVMADMKAKIGTIGAKMAI